MITTRLSIPGNACVHCGTIQTKKLTCSGCGWVDPLTKKPKLKDKMHYRKLKKNNLKTWKMAISVVLVTSIIVSVAVMF